ncbi:hypothetical protein [Cellulosilyticum sp. I15G10I2]|uniref:hypothetical protein n=1 Tax=Cellulosilyticum sp. I15G10I2 TaxID=1892843 RepID=UPI00085BD73C|nr:hypothetical protein [Cellulosilyticum sp. I15G10I2]
MDSHKRNNNHKTEKIRGFNPLKYIGMMGVCCILPILIAVILPFLPFGNLGANRIIAAIVPFICPIMMGLMMLGLLRDGKSHSCCSHNKKEETNEEK